MIFVFLMYFVCSLNPIVFSYFDQSYIYDNYLGVFVTIQGVASS